MTDTNQFFLSFLPGYCQGLSKVFTTYPFDVIKTKMQTNSYKTTFECVSQLIKHDKSIFFRGITVPLISFPIDRAISYKVYDELNNKNMNPYYSAFFSGFTSSIFNVPMQYITTNAINMKKEEYKGAFHLIKTMIANKDNIYKGYWLDTSRAIFGSTIFLGTYGNIKKILPDNNKNTILSSILSISMTWIITFPIDTIRVEKQININKTMMELIKQRYVQYGVLNFYNGLFPVLLRSYPSTIIGMLVYENVKKMTKHI